MKRTTVQAHSEASGCSGESWPWLCLPFFSGLLRERVNADSAANPASVGITWLLFPQAWLPGKPFTGFFSVGLCRHWPEVQSLCQVASHAVLTPSSPPSSSPLLTSSFLLLLVSLLSLLSLSDSLFLPLSPISH